MENKKRLIDAPAEDAVEVVHGRWRWCGQDRFNDAYECSECGKIAMDDSNYCPNCGAKMDGKSNVPMADAEIDFDYEAED